MARALCIEAGKPIKDSRGEVTRLIDTFMIAMEECTRNYGASGTLRCPVLRRAYGHVVGPKDMGGTDA